MRSKQRIIGFNLRYWFFKEINWNKYTRWNDYHVTNYIDSSHVELIEGENQWVCENPGMQNRQTKKV